MAQLTTKERQLLNDQASHEKICIHKYQQYASQANDPQLKQLFQSYAQQEQQHLNTINSILSGLTPDTNQQQGQQQSQPQSAASGSQAQGKSANASQADYTICSDLLMTEKFVSGAYDTAIFEFADTNIRQALNHIQKEEQQHGEGIFNYMSANGMYPVSD